MSRRAVHVAIVGRVQGVGYRAWCFNAARELGLSGWVRNRRSGEVEVLLSGASSSVNQMLELARRGPAGSRVDSVEILNSGDICEGDFEVLPSV